MGKMEDLERQLVEMKRAREAVINTTENCSLASEKNKAAAFDRLSAFLKAPVQDRVLKGATWDRRLLADTFLDVALKEFFGPDILENLAKF